MSDRHNWSTMNREEKLDAIMEGLEEAVSGRYRAPGPTVSGHERARLDFLARLTEQWGVPGLVAGLKAGEVVFEWNGESVSGVNVLETGDVEMTVTRAGKPTTLTWFPGDGIIAEGGV